MWYGEENRQQLFPFVQSSIMNTWMWLNIIRSNEDNPLRKTHRNPNVHWSSIHRHIWPQTKYSEVHWKKQRKWWLVSIFLNHIHNFIIKSIHWNIFYYIEVLYAPDNYNDRMKEIICSTLCHNKTNISDIWPWRFIVEMKSVSYERQENDPSYQICLCLMLPDIWPPHPASTWLSFVPVSICIVMFTVVRVTVCHIGTFLLLGTIGTL